MTWSEFFPSGTAVQALPNWRSPRLYIPASSMQQRWRRSAFYPAFRKSALLYRVGLRAATAVKPSIRTTDSGSSEWKVGLFVREVVPEVASVSLLLGTKGPAQKATLQLCDKADNVVGYIKYGETEAAVAGIRNEVSILRSIADDLGPVLLKAGEFANGYAMVTSSIDGEPVPAALPPIQSVIQFQEKLLNGDSLVAQDHPGLQQILRGEKRGWVSTLAAREWPTALQHGDFAPWNLKQCDMGIRAFDWEYATTAGFPYLDLAFFSLQTDVKIYHAQPVDAFNRATSILSGLSSVGSSYAATIVRIAAFDAFDKGIRDGHSPDAFLQDWYRGVWEAAG